MEDVLIKLDLLSDQWATYITYQLGSTMARREGKYENINLAQPTNSFAKITKHWNGSSESELLSKNAYIKKYKID